MRSFSFLYFACRCVVSLSSTVLKRFVFQIFFSRELVFEISSFCFCFFVFVLLLFLSFLNIYVFVFLFGFRFVVEKSLFAFKKCFCE